MKNIIWGLVMLLIASSAGAIEELRNPPESAPAPAASPAVVCPDLFEQLCASKTKALAQMFHECMEGSPWCVGEIWPYWRQHNAECLSEGQVVCIKSCSNVGGVGSMWCIHNCQ
jgi:hypothetical protein